ncbi:hypothetical protein C0993_012437 [Termitomyces sp. T159_Od127]|nr:hypothetical protein C0993_012437 [Termitomyces sp. T159_Od127]
MAQMWFPGADLPKNRLPSSKHEGSNGFRPPYPPKPDAGSNSSAEPWAALDAHRTAQYVLTQKCRPIPTLEQMREELKPDTPESIKKRIEDLKAQHLSDLQRMYLWHAEEYLDDAYDMYRALDEVTYPRKDGINEDDGDRHISRFYEESRRYIPQQMRWEDERERLRYSHLEQLVPLYQELKQIELREKEERKRREADFPTSIEDYHSKSADVKMRVARFLQTTDEARQEKMLSDFGWAWRQVKPLQEIYKKNDAFKAEIVLKMMEVKDPRQRVF